jgi:radical S-adenosyl methionine domain-containing protein 2
MALPNTLIAASQKAMGFAAINDTDLATENGSSLAVPNAMTSAGQRKPSQHAERQLVVNWHLTEACNYGCDFCYAKWVKPKARELIHDGKQVRHMLEQLFEFFRPGQLTNSQTNERSWDSVRLNLAGGEPLLYRERTLDAVQIARELGFELSMITNGSHLDRALLGKLAPQLSLLGISVDSGRESVNREIGRADKRTGQVLGLDFVTSSFRTAREFNPDLQLKVNTVVNKLNWQEDMTSAIRRLAPGKWKVLQMLPLQNRNLAVSGAEFDEFVRRHDSLGDIMSVEDNDSMTESYIMIDPLGRFYQNTTAGQGGYHYSRPILDVGAREAFAEMSWSESKFLSRYAKSIT